MFYHLIAIFDTERDI